KPSMKPAPTHPWVQRAGRSAVAALARHVNYHVVRGMADRDARPDTDRFFGAATWTITQDYVRDATLELLCREIDEHDVPGALAELGVFRGDFAWLMSTYLPERRIHLFDTFGGFDAEELELDERAGLVAQSIDFSPTAPAAVAARFASPELVALHIGRFPDTTDGVSGPFALVSIDADLYAPMRSALIWFYERLSPGGAILAHDFNNARFGGARKAVREFQDATGVAIVPLPDWGGTAVIVKPRAPVREPG
ncbi:MAG: TylF/MycF/NovP-related O-methyltransferase, partial [Solirubrobacteraceae bacterium]